MNFNQSEGEWFVGIRTKDREKKFPLFILKYIYLELLLNFSRRRN